MEKNTYKKPELGDKCKDTLTGFKGIVTAHARYITGCDQFLLSPQEKGRDGRWFDELRLKVVKRGAYKIPEDSVAANPPGGPSNPNEFAPMK